MNLNHESINLEAVSSQARQWYAFPEDKDLLARWKSGELTTSKESRAAYTARAQAETAVIFGGLTLGALGYCFLLAPTGKVIRDRMEAKMSASRRFIRRAVPFVGLAIPFVLVRAALQVDNGYRN